MNKKYLIIALASIFALGGSYLLGYSKGNASTTREYEEQIAKDKLDQSEAAKKLEEEYRAKEQESAKKVSEALALRDKAMADAARLRADSARVRESANSLAKQLSRASQSHAASGNGDSERLGKCESLLSESAALLGEGQDLATEGAALSVRIAADKDAIIKAQ